MELSMSYKSLLLHIEQTDEAQERLRVAIALAKVFEARVIGVGARALDPLPDPIGLSVVKLKEEIDEGLANAERLFKDTIAGEGVAHVWHSEVGYPSDAMLRYACEADLIVSARNVEGAASEIEAGVADLIMSAGLPLLAVPSRAQLDTRRIIIGWKNTRETRRAVWDALPLLKRAEGVRVLRFASDPAPELSNVVERLRLHKVPAKAEIRQRTERSVAEDLLVAAEAMGAGLIVAGAYGHSRLHEWALGGVTEELLTRSHTPVLFSH
jgi:nucleotide-binding universal stress UspA family protein